MNKKINLIEILKDCPKGLFSIILLKQENILVLFKF